jgi:hypothetical protein
MAQSDILQTQISIHLKNATIKEFIQYIELNYNIAFFYSDDALPDEILPLVSFESQSLETILTLLFRDNDLGFKLVNNQVVIIRMNKPKRNWHVSGTLSDKLTGERLIGVAIYDKNRERATLSNAYGYYSIALQEGEHELTVSYLGYEKLVLRLNVNGNLKMDCQMRLSDVLLEEVQVIETLSESSINTTEMNNSTLIMRNVKMLPGFLGENDVIRNLAILPGVLQGDVSDGGIYVRGGSSNQTVFQMDEATIYNPSHFGGIFSVFNPDIINSVEVYKGDMPVSIDGAISSLINVHLREGNNQEWRFKGSIGLISAKGLVEGPVKKDTSSVLVAFRRSYVDMFLKLPPNKESLSIDYYFYDFNMKFNQKINEKNRLYISAYSGTDFLDLYTQLKRSNQMANLRWNHIYSSSLFSNTTFIYSRNYLGQETMGPNMGFNWHRYINNYLFKHDISLYLRKNQMLKFGISTNPIDIKPFVIQTFSSGQPQLKESGNNEYLFVSGVYASFNSSFSNGISYDAGFRINHNYNPKANLHTVAGNATDEEQYQNSQKYYSNFSVEPRINVKYLLRNNMALKAGYNRQVNALHQLLIAETGIAVNRWIPATHGFKPQISNNYSLGFYYDITPNLKAETEVYFRSMKNLIEALQNENILVKANPDMYMYLAKAKAQGVEVTLAYKIARFNALANYTFSQSRWQTNGINKNHWYSSFQDRPHSINFSATQILSKRISVSATWVFSSGTPYTQLSGKYMIDGKPMALIDDEQVNSERLPNYHRLDLSIDLAGKKNSVRKWKGFWNFSIYNAYFHKNPYSIVYFYPEDVNESNINYKLNPKYLYFYQFIPSVTYKFEF